MVALFSLVQAHVSLSAKMSSTPPSRVPSAQHWIADVMTDTLQSRPVLSLPRSAGAGLQYLVDV